MKIFKKLLPVLLMLLLTGCAGPKISENRLVTGIHIRAEQEHQHLERNYVQPEKMEVILAYLRTLDEKTPAHTDPERYQGLNCRIDLTYADGKTRQIFQRADRFLSENFGPWQCIDSQKGATLFLLVKNMPGD